MDTTRLPCTADFCKVVSDEYNVTAGTLALVRPPHLVQVSFRLALVLGVFHSIQFQSMCVLIYPGSGAPSAPPNSAAHNWFSRPNIGPFKSVRASHQTGCHPWTWDFAPLNVISLQVYPSCCMHH